MIDEVEVLFPYDYIYPEQYQYMAKLKSILGKGHCLLEMPTGTGKTVTLLSLILSYQYAHPETGKLIYCTRTVQEMDKVIAELRRVMDYREKELSNMPDGSTNPRCKILGVCLSSRRNMCIHKRISQYDNPIKTDAECRNLTVGFVREEKANDANVELCEFYEGYMATATDALLEGVYSIADIRKLGRERKWCPYFATRHFINLANVIVFNYQYMLDPKISGLVSRGLEKNSIVVFDEAHNIDNICIEALSVTIDRRTVRNSRDNVRKLSKAIAKMEETDISRLQEEYQQLLTGLVEAGTIDRASNIMVNPVLAPDILAEAVPGNIRRAKHFVMFLKSLIEYLNSRLKYTHETMETPIKFMVDVQRKTQMQETRALQFAFDRLNIMLRTLKIKDIDEFTPLLMLTNFATLVATYEEGFVVIFEPTDDRTPTIPDPKLQLCCLDASLAMKPVFDQFSSVIITSGTLSPLDFFPKILNFRPALIESFSMTLSRDCICPMIVTHGGDQVPITSKFSRRQDTAVVQNYGRLLLDMAKVVPDGMVCFFTSYTYMEEIITTWSSMGILNNLLKYKLIFIETKDIVETTLALDSFKKACDCGRGAVFFSVARGKVAEGVDFDRHYGRSVILFGIPFQYTLSRVLRARLAFLREHHNINEGDFLSFDALRQASQCVGRVIRSKLDYGIMIFADQRYSRSDKRDKLPGWIKRYLKSEHLNMSIDLAVTESRLFLKQMAQPIPHKENLGRTMLSLKHLKKLQAKEIKKTQFLDASNPSIKSSVIPDHNSKGSSIPRLEKHSLSDQHMNKRTKLN